MDGDGEGIQAYGKERMTRRGSAEPDPKIAQLSQRFDLVDYTKAATAFNPSLNLSTSFSKQG
jgi:hypothetical protein